MRLNHPLFTTFLSAILIASLPTGAEAACFQKRPGAVCGDKRICVSGAPNAREGWFDPNSCLPSSPVCRALSQIADEFVGGSKTAEPPAGKAKLEIASAHRVPRRSDCKKYGIPASHCRTNIERGGATRSAHANCAAADFLVPNYQNGSTKKKLANFMASRVSYAGRNVYPTGRAHVSSSAREAFYTCRRGKGVCPDRVPASNRQRRASR